VLDGGEERHGMLRRSIYGDSGANSLSGSNFAEAFA
jgi:hypothetical protein